MTTIESLKPQQKFFVMDLVREAGIDVSDWANFKGGEKRARTNPKYCYEWTFVGPGITILNVWHDSIVEDSNKIISRSNLRDTSKHESTKGVWKKRAEKFDRVVHHAYQNNQSIRVIINDGKKREGNSKTEKASKVEHRCLDSVPWYVSSYDNSSGKFVLARGTKPPRTIDQFDLDIESHTPTEKRTITGEVFNRSPEVRRIVLQRANGKCEFCGTEGFKTSAGLLFLETHHIIPLSEGGADTIYNVVAICPNHHREAHYGQDADIMRNALAKRVNESINVFEACVI